MKSLDSFINDNFCIEVQLPKGPCFLDVVTKPVINSININKYTRNKSYNFEATNLDFLVTHIHTTLSSFYKNNYDYAVKNLIEDEDFNVSKKLVANLSKCITNVKFAYKDFFDALDSDEKDIALLENRLTNLFVHLGNCYDQTIFQVAHTLFSDFEYRPGRMVGIKRHSKKQDNFYGKLKREFPGIYNIICNQQNQEKNAIWDMRRRVNHGARLPVEQKSYSFIDDKPSNDKGNQTYHLNNSQQHSPEPAQGPDYNNRFFSRKSFFEKSKHIHYMTSNISEIKRSKKDAKLYLQFNGGKYEVDNGFALGLIHKCLSDCYDVYKGLNHVLISRKYK